MTSPKSRWRRDFRVRAVSPWGSASHKRDVSGLTALTPKSLTPKSHAGGTLSIGSPERAKPLVERFDEIWESGEPGVTGSVLGL